jgi:hypothetical protein
MSCETTSADKEDKGLPSAESGKILQNPQPPRNPEQGLTLTKPAKEKGNSWSEVGDHPNEE